MKRMKLLSLSAITLALVFSSCAKKAKTDNTNKEEIPNVRVISVGERMVEQNYELSATVQPQIKNSIAPAMPGRIRDILVEVGQHVAKGQKLVQMDVATLSNSETQIQNLKRIYKRTQELYNVGGASQQELDNAKMQLDLAQTNANNQSENTFLTSPISGVVTERSYDDGDMYSGQKPVLVVMSINPVKLVVNVSESYYSRVKLGMPISVKIDVYPNQAFQGRVSLIYPTIDERTRTFPVEIRLTNNNSKVRPGMFARVTLEFGKVKRVVVPDQSIVKQSGSGSKYVYIYNNGKVTLNQVELGRRIEADYEVISGLKGNEQIVVAGQSKLVDGGKANIVK